MKRTSSISRLHGLPIFGLLPCLIISTFFATVSVSAQAPFFDDAFKRAAFPPIQGSRWVVKARINLNGPNKEYVSAGGLMTLGSDGMLAGELPMSTNYTPVANNTISLHIRKSNPAVITIVRNIGGKPYLGRGPVIASLPVDPNFNYLAGPITWSDGTRVLQIFLETEFVKANPGGSGETKRKGARYQIGGFVRVSNSSDGFADNTVEVYGILRLRHYVDGKEVHMWTLVNVIEQDANNGFQLSFQDNNFVDYYEDEKGHTLTLDGDIQDRDAGQGLTGDDPMFRGIDCMNKYPLYTLIRITASSGSMLCKGDQNSESADIRIYAKKIKDL